MTEAYWTFKSDIFSALRKFIRFQSMPREKREEKRNVARELKSEPFIESLCLFVYVLACFFLSRYEIRLLCMLGQNVAWFLRWNQRWPVCFVDARVWEITLCAILQFACLPISINMCDTFAKNCLCHFFSFGISNFHSTFLSSSLKRMRTKLSF